MTTPLLAKIRRRIERHGPLTVAEYMEMALSDPEHGYYATRDPFGAAGDFITAPEVSQMFGEIVGLWAAYMWQALGGPAPFALVELGPGRGTLMADMLRACRLAEGFAEAARVHLVETSPALRARQKETLAGFAQPVSWHERFAGVPAGPAIVIANEFFDALPVHQYVRSGEGWRERMVGLDASGRLVWSKSGPLAECPVQGAARLEAKDGMIGEESPERCAVAGEIAGRLAGMGGAALIMDYGYLGPVLGDTLQAVRRHAFADPLKDPGEADLTAHVDFSALCRAARRAGANSFGPITQAQFLFALGIAARAEKLKEINPERASEIDAAVARLTGADAMGTLFKVAAFTGPGAPPPPPFGD